MTERAAASRAGPIIKWHFAESDEDGAAWLRNPALLQAYVDYESNGETSDSVWYRVMVVTRSWLETHVQAVRSGLTGPLWIALPPMVVVPDASGSALRLIVDAVIQQGGVDAYATRLNQSG